MITDLFFTSYGLLLISAVVGLSALTAPLGCFLVWRRLSFFGDALSHGALLGVILGILLDIPLSLMVLITSGIFAATIHFKKFNLPTETVLAVFSYGALACALLLFAHMRARTYDPTSFMFGDILLVDKEDVCLVYGFLIFVIGVLWRYWHTVLFLTFNESLAVAEGVSRKHGQIIFTLILSLCITVGFKLVGALLLPALLVIPATAAARFSKTPEQMIAITFLMSALCGLIGLCAAFIYNLPVGPSIVGSCFALFLITIFVTKKEA